jgi:acyl-CoA synthetase (AMP-forming)/AMP-acid ligase II
MTASPALLHELLDHAERYWPDRPAVTDAAGGLSHRELAQASRRAGDWLRQSGAGRGDRVVLTLRSGLLTAALAWGAARAGVVFTIVHEQVRNTPLRQLLADCEPALLVSDDPDALALAREQGVAAAPAAVAAAAVLPRDSQPAADSAPAPGWTPLSVDPVCLIYTSGSTSQPKAVVSTHTQMAFAACAIQSALEYTPEDVVYCPLPLSFDYGLYQLFLGAASGANIWLGRPAEAGPALLASLRASQATVLAAVPAVAEGLSRLLRRAPGQAPPLRLLTNTGAAMQPGVLTALREQIPTLQVQLMFGLTECKRTTIMPPDGDLARPRSCGLPLPGTEVIITDEDGRPLPSGEPGQIVVRGPHVMAGYWRRPEETARRFHRAAGLFPELRTGDYGWLDDEGYLYFRGRRDDIYKSRGFRVSATEVEAAAMRVPGVDAAAVLPPAGGRPATLVAVTRLSPAELVAALRDELEEFKIPEQCAVAASLPLNGNGKVDKRALTESLKETAGV